MIWKSKNSLNNRRPYSRSKTPKNVLLPRPAEGCLSNWRWEIGNIIFFVKLSDWAISRIWCAAPGSVLQGFQNPANFLGVLSFRIFNLQSLEFRISEITSSCRWSIVYHSEVFRWYSRKWILTGNSAAGLKKIQGPSPLAAAWRNREISGFSALLERQARKLHPRGKPSADSRLALVLARRWADKVPGVWPSIVLRMTIIIRIVRWNRTVNFNLVRVDLYTLQFEFLLISILHNIFSVVAWHCVVWGVLVCVMRFGRLHCKQSSLSFPPLSLFLSHSDSF